MMSEIQSMTYLAAVLLVALGVAGVILGEGGDSPGLQLMGVVLVVGALALGARRALRTR